MTKRNKKFIEINETQNEQDIDMDEFLMQRVADAIWDEELRALDEACEKYKDLDFEEDEDTRLQAIFDRRDRIEKKRKAVRKTKKFAKIAAVVVLALGVFGTAGYFSTTEAFRAELLNLIFKAHDKYDEIVVDENNQQPVDEDNEQGNIMNDGEAGDPFVLTLDYVPGGYELVQNDFEEGIFYQNIKDEKIYILLSYNDSNVPQRMNNEDSLVERIYRNGHEVELCCKENVCFAIWQDRDCHFSLTATYIDKEAFLKVIEGIRWTEDN